MRVPEDHAQFLYFFWHATDAHILICNDYLLLFPSPPVDLGANFPVIDISLEDFHSGIPISIIKSTACLYELCSDKTTRVAALPSALRPCPAVLPPPATATYLERVSLKAAP